MILLTGGSGQLGTALRPLLGEVTAPPTTDLDLSKPAQVEAYLDSHRPRVIVNCAAYTAVDQAEDEPEVANNVNGESVGVMARYAAGAGIPLVTFSTDYVFDGKANRPYLESSPTSPLNAYGRSKALGERLALASHPGCLVVRTSWLLSATHPNFVTKIIDRARSAPVEVVSDQIGCPTYAPDLAGAVVEALQGGTTGLLHLTNGGETSWFDLARTACALAGIDPERVAPVDTADYPTRAKRPAYSVLESERLAEAGIAPLRPWQEAVAELVAETALANGRE